MGKSRKVNLIRGLHFVFSVFLHLEHDPFCCHCTLFKESVDIGCEKFLSLEKTLQSSETLSGEMEKMFTNITEIIANLDIPQTPESQHQKGYCIFPEHICLANAALSVYNNIEEQISEAMSSV